MKAFASLSALLFLKNLNELSQKFQNSEIAVFFKVHFASETFLTIERKLGFLSTFSNVFPRIWKDYRRSYRTKYSLLLMLL